MTAPPCAGQRYVGGRRTAADADAAGGVRCCRGSVTRMHDVKTRCGAAAASSVNRFINHRSMPLPATRPTGPAGIPLQPPRIDCLPPRLISCSGSRRRRKANHDRVAAAELTAAERGRTADRLGQGRLLDACEGEIDRPTRHCHQRGGRDGDKRSVERGETE